MRSQMHGRTEYGQPGCHLVMKFLPSDRNLATCPCTQVTDLGQVLHMIGGTAAAFIIFFLPGLLLVNAAIVKLDAPPGHTASGDLDAEAPLLVR